MGSPGVRVCLCPGSPNGLWRTKLSAQELQVSVGEGRIWDLGHRGCSFELFWDGQSPSMALDAYEQIG